MPLAARAQQAARPPRMAMFHPAIPPALLTETGGGSAWRAFFGELRRLGYVEILDEECTDFCCGLTNSAECARMRARGLSPLFGAGGAGSCSVAVSGRTVAARNGICGVHRVGVPRMGGRRLTAILAADIAGYSALMGASDVDTLADLKGHQSAVLPLIAGYNGRIIDTAGDGILAEFPSVFNAVKCAIAIQEVMSERNASVAPERRMQFRIGINQGDVLFDEERIYGDGINIAARLEGICEPGGICISGKVYEEIKGRFEIHYEDIGDQT